MYNSRYKIFIKENYNHENYYEDIIDNISKTYSNVINKIEIKKNNFGKPYLKGIDNINISISHSKNFLIYAFSENNIAIDIEIRRDVKKFMNKVSKKIFHIMENEYIFRDIKKSEERFLEIWTRKESYVKFHNKSILNDLREVNTIGNESIKTFKNQKYIYSIYC